MRESNLVGRNSGLDLKSWKQLKDRAFDLEPDGRSPDGIGPLTSDETLLVDPVFHDVFNRHGNQMFPALKLMGSRQSERGRERENVNCICLAWSTLHEMR